MKPVFYISILFLFFIFPGKDKYSLTVTVSGLKPVGGELYISIHDRPEFFATGDSARLKSKIRVNKEAESIVFENVPAGRYAIAVYHDENLNGIMDANQKGIPAEGYGFSMKSKFLGRPGFEQAAFDLNRNDTVQVRMIYHKAPEH